MTDLLNLHLSACLEESIEKIQITGQIMPITYEMKKNAKILVNESINDIINTQRELEARFAQVLQNRNPKDKDSIEELTKSLKAAIHGLNRAQKQNPLSNDSLQKIEAERLFLEMILESYQHNLNFDALRETVGLEKNNKLEFESIIKREETSRKTIKELEKALKDIKVDKEVKLQERNELIAHLKDRFQELKAKTNMEAKYVKKSTDNSVLQVKKKCELTETELKQLKDKMIEQIEDERRCNEELKSYLEGAIVKLKNLTEYWTEKSNRETIAKQVELDKIKQARARDLEKYQNLLKVYNEYEAVAIEDRQEKDKARRQAEQEKLELEASIKIQGWWRGMMLRHKLGPHGKKKKGKKGKKEKKK